MNFLSLGSEPIRKTVVLWVWGVAGGLTADIDWLARWHFLCTCGPSGAASVVGICQWSPTAGRRWGLTPLSMSPYKVAETISRLLS